MSLAVPFDLGYVLGIQVNSAAVAHRVATVVTKRTLKKDAQVAAYLRAIRCIDLTTLSGADTDGNVARLCHKALHPLSPRLMDMLELTGGPLTTGAVCVYHPFVTLAAEILGDRIPVAAVSTDFPHGMTDLDIKLMQIDRSIKAGAKEIDIVISRRLALNGQWRELYDEIKAMVDMCGDRAHLKAILAVGDLDTLTMVARASAVAIMAGAHFIKTSTGMEATNATLPASLVMVREIDRFRRQVDPNRMVGFKPAGGIRTGKDAQQWLILMMEELGESWTTPEWFRFGASGLLGDIERQLDYHLTGDYSAAQFHPMG